jgi:hypothetical protein
MFTTSTLNRIFSYSVARFANEKVTAGSIYSLFWKDVKILVSFSLKFTVHLHYNFIFFRYFLDKLINTGLYSFIMRMFLVVLSDDF